MNIFIAMKTENKGVKSYNMEKKDPSDIGKQIEDLVQNAIDKLDFDQLSNQIGKAVDKWNQDIVPKVKPSFWEVKDEVRQAADYSRSVFTEQVDKVKNKWKSSKATNKTEKKELIVPVFNRSSFKVKGILYTIFSSIGLILFGLATLIEKEVPLGILTIICFAFLIEGTEILKKYKRMLRYIYLLKKKGFIEIQELERYMGIKRRKILSDIKKMLALGMLPEGHLDKSQTYLIGTNEIYEQYCRTKEELERRKQVEEEKREQDKTLSEAEKAIAKEIEEGKAQVAEIRRLNDALPEPIISEKLYQLEKISEKIFLYVEKHPDQLEEIQRLKSYYLPTMLKLVTAYHKVKQEEIKSDNIDKMCSQIEETLDTMNSALEYMYNELYADEALDVATDISVLKTMLAREGLVGNEFENIKEEQKDE